MAKKKNEATTLDPAQAAQLEQSLDEQPNTVEDTLTPAPAVSEAELTASDPTKLVPAGSADSTADATADGQPNGTQNTHPQSPTHKGELSEADKLAIYEEAGAPGSQVLAIAEKHGITAERVFEVVDEINGVGDDDD